jgi:hypothetical protein
MTPEEREAFRAELEQWAEDRRQFAARLEKYERQLRADRERWERRRRRINRLTLGLLGRPDVPNAS